MADNSSIGLVAFILVFLGFLPTVVGIGPMNRTDTHAPRMIDGKLRSTASRGSRVTRAFVAYRFGQLPICWSTVTSLRFSCSVRYSSANRVDASQPLLMSTGQIWQGRVCSRPPGRDFVAVSFFEGETDGFETN
jgi:hypothetical protein